MNAISGPVALYANVPIHADYYQPSRFVISGITLGQTTVVTTSVAHNYVIGQLVRLIIPPSFGCRQLNESSGYVLSIPTTTSVEVGIYSAGGNPYKSSSATTVAQILAIGDINGGIISTTGNIVPTTYIPGSFNNIS
jgi:hypothetical protein